MSRISGFFGKTATNLKSTILRFPVILALLAGIAIIVSIMIEDSFTENQQGLTRLIFAGVFGVFLGITAQFFCERFENYKKQQWTLRIATLLVAVLYYFLLTQTDRYAEAMFIRLFVCCFALLALYLYLPSVKEGADFGKIALAHFKAAFTAVLYSVVLFVGLSAIYYAIDFLLFNLDNELIGHIANVVFVFFMPFYYLSLLPKFNTKDEIEQDKNDEAYIYPRFLEILVSYILIPLITTFTFVLIAYFLKIVFTRKWPVGQIGPMVLVYSAVGLILYILSSNLVNRYATVFKKVFPITLIPLVCLQLVSWYIRINAYGITESRYYVALFGVFAIVCAVYLIFSKNKNPNSVAILAFCFAIVSIVPPVDAFNMSRKSQTGRIESILERNNMLSDQKLIPNGTIPNDDKKEITNIIDYMDRMGYLGKLSWIPEEYLGENKAYNEKLYNDFDKLFGFERYYNYNENTTNYINAMADMNASIDISGFQTLTKLNIHSYNESEGLSTDFSVGGKMYSLNQKTDDKGELIIDVLDKDGNLVLDIPTNTFFKQISEKSSDQKNMLPLSDLTFDIENEVIHIRVIVENISMEKSDTGNFTNINGSATILATNP